MSKRVRVPAPNPRFIPSVIRTFGPRFILALGGFAALLLLVGGGSYMLSRATPTPYISAAGPQTSLPTNRQVAQNAQVLGASTQSNTASDTAPAQSEVAAGGTAGSAAVSGSTDCVTACNPVPAALPPEVQPTIDQLNGTAKSVTAPVGKTLQHTLDSVSQLLSGL